MLARHPLYNASPSMPAALAYSSQYQPMNPWPAPTATPVAAAARIPATSHPMATCPTYLPSTASQAPIALSAQYGAYYPAPSDSANTPPTSPASAYSFSHGTTILISGLPYDQSENELRSRLSTFGDLIYLVIYPDKGKLGKDRGTARARYRAHAEAARAVHQLDGSHLHNRKISVKLDRDDASAAGPSRKPLHEIQSGATNSSKQRKSVTFSSGSNSTKQQWQGDSSRTSSRGSDQSGQGDSSKGPLVVNGARKSPTRQIRRRAASESDSDSSSDDDDSDRETRSDDEGENVREVSRNHDEASAQSVRLTCSTTDALV
jgi:RNA recognition motif-containing protein